MHLLALLLGLSGAALAADGPWVAASGNVGVGTAGVGRGGGGSLALGWSLPLLHHKLYLGPVLTGALNGHRAGGLHQDEQLEATIRYREDVVVRDAQVGIFASYGKHEGARAELTLAGGYGATRSIVTGDLDGTELPGSATEDRGLALSLRAGGAAPVGPLELIFGVDWRRVPVAGTAVNLIGPQVGLRWGPF
jgi:hypothetical protein